MAGLNLPKPKRGFRIDQVLDNKFETEEASRGEDALRVQSLRSRLEVSAAEQAEYNGVAHRIEEVFESRTLASSRAMRWFRITIVGALWYLCRGKQVYFVTLMPRGYTMTPEELQHVSPAKANQWLRIALNRCGASSATPGWIYAYLEGEYNPATGMLQLHWHAIVTNSAMRAVIEQLRGHRAFKRIAGAHNNTDGIDQRIVVKRVSSKDVPFVISYIVKAAWWSRWRDTDPDGNRQTQRMRSRIPEPAHSRVLVWLDRWRHQDMSMLLNLRVGIYGLKRRQ